MRVLLLLSFLLVGCGAAHQATYDGSFAASYNKFIHYCSQYNRDCFQYDLQIKFGDTKYRGQYVIGICSTNGNERVVIISNTDWIKLTDISREALIFHELGHCLLDRSHNNVTINNQPMSIMNAYLLADEYYQENYLDYINELFQGE